MTEMTDERLKAGGVVWQDLGWSDSVHDDVEAEASAKGQLARAETEVVAVAAATESAPHTVPKRRKLEKRRRPRRNTTPTTRKKESDWGTWGRGGRARKRKRRGSGQGGEIVLVAQHVPD